MENWLRFCLVFMFLLGFFGCVNKNEKRLIDRVNQYYGFLIDEEYDNSWGMWARDKGGNIKWPKSIFIDYWKMDSSIQKLLSINIEKIEFQGEHDIKMAYIGINGVFKIVDKKIGKKNKNWIDIWIFQNNDWYRFEQD